MNANTVRKGQRSLASYRHRGLTARLSRECGISDVHASLILQGKRNPTLGLAYKMARLMGITMDELYRRIQWARRNRESEQAAVA